MATTEERHAAAVTSPPAPVRTRDRLMPRSVLGLSVLILFTALGAAFSGAVLYSYYQYKLDQSNKKLTQATLAATKALKDSQKIIDAETANAKRQISDELGPIRQLAGGEETLSKLVDKVGPSVWFVQTLDEAGQPAVGSAFVVASDADQTFLVTAFSAVRAATHQPGPAVTVSKGDDDEKATLWTWQEDHDLALLIIKKGNQPKLDWVSSKPAVRLGERVFAVSGQGGAGASITQGNVSDVFARGIQHTAPVGPAYRGAPLVNSDSQVVGVASADYAPLGFAPGTVTYAVPIASTCDRILRCPSGNAGGPGQRGG